MDTSQQCTAPVSRRHSTVKARQACPVCRVTESVPSASQTASLKRLTVNARNVEDVAVRDLVVDGGTARACKVDNSVYLANCSATDIEVASHHKPSGIGSSQPNVVISGDVDVTGLRGGTWLIKSKHEPFSGKDSQQSKVTDSRAEGNITISIVDDVTLDGCSAKGMVVIEPRWATFAGWVRFANPVNGQVVWIDESRGVGGIALDAPEDFVQHNFVVRGDSDPNTVFGHLRDILHPGGYGWNQHTFNSANLLRGIVARPSDNSKGPWVDARNDKALAAILEGAWETADGSLVVDDAYIELMLQVYPNP